MDTSNVNSFEYKQYYTDFQRPPFAQTFYPTEEEFTDPIAYVSKITPEAEKYGVVKIVPPKSFKPTFAIDPTTFTFTPRIQNLGDLEAISRERNAFIERVKLYCELKRGEFRPPTLEGRSIDLFMAHVLVRAEGGFDSVCANKKWTPIAKALSFKSSQAPSKLKDHYAKFVVPVLEIIEKMSPIKKDDEDEDGTRGLGEGGSKKTGKEDKKKKAKNVCSRCSRRDSEDKLVSCEDCGLCLHASCMRPAMKEVPKNGWHCPPCIESWLREVGDDEGFADSSCSYTLETFAAFANDYKKNIFKKEPSKVTIDEIEKMYWRNMLDGEMDLEVKYGADLSAGEVGSGFCRKTDPNLSVKDRMMAHHPWNLNNMPLVKDSVLSHMDSSISGMIVPWVYVGMVFSTFCWHTEDHWTYSVNYNHYGEPKIWYGAGGDQATKFEEVVASLCPSLFNLHSDLLHHMTVAVNPHLLRARGVDIYTIHQNPGEFVITFPRAYHAGFNQGLNVAEAVNFAPIDWLKVGRDSMLSYGTVGRKSVFAHDELVMKIARACDKLSNGMALAAFDELRTIHSRERENREEAKRRGVKRREKLIFEEIKEDDEKMCSHCNTTLFMSALRCAHGHSVCLNHMDHLCKKCSLDETVLLYSYEVAELVPMMDQLMERARKYNEWAKKGIAMQKLMREGTQADVSTLECLLEEARSHHYPLNGVYSHLSQMMIDCKKTVNSAMLTSSPARKRRRT